MSRYLILNKNQNKQTTAEVETYRDYIKNLEIFSLDEFLQCVNSLVDRCEKSFIIDMIDDFISVNSEKCTNKKAVKKYIIDCVFGR